MSYIVPKEIPNCCGRCPCFHAEKLMYCQAVKADKNKRIYAPYGEGRPDWCLLTEVKVPHGELINKTEILEYLITCLQNGRPRSDLYSINEIINYIEEMDVIVKAEGKLY
jgi:hypothetical protein